MIESLVGCKRQIDIPFCSVSTACIFLFDLTCLVQICTDMEDTQYFDVIVYSLFLDSVSKFCLPKVLSYRI